MKAYSKVSREQQEDSIHVAGSFGTVCQPDSPLPAEEEDGRGQGVPRDFNQQS